MICLKEAPDRGIKRKPLEDDDSIKKPTSRGIKGKPLGELCFFFNRPLIEERWEAV